MNKVIIFVAGVVLGSAITWQYAKRKYEGVYEEDMSSGETDSPNTYTETEKGEYITLLNDKGYTTNKKIGFEQPTVKDVPPYPISPDDFGEIDEYDRISLTYYADGILADDEAEVITDASDILGEDWLDHFGEYEDDALFVRDDNLKCDYEVLMSNTKYYSLPKSNLHRVSKS